MNCLCKIQERIPLPAPKNRTLDYECPYFLFNTNVMITKRANKLCLLFFINYSTEISVIVPHSLQYTIVNDSSSVDTESYSES